MFYWELEEINKCYEIEEALIVLDDISFNKEIGTMNYMKIRNAREKLREKREEIKRRLLSDDAKYVSERFSEMEWVHNCIK